MNSPENPGIFFPLAADAILVIHALFIAFVIFGLLLILIGAIAGWQWIRNFWFRAAHLLAIGIVVGQSWAGIACPLTVWERHLRREAGQPVYEESFVAHWLHQIIFFEAEPWVFTVCYTLFGALVAGTWIFCRPHWPVIKSGN